MLYQIPWTLHTYWVRRSLIDTHSRVQHLDFCQIRDLQRFSNPVLNGVLLIPGPGIVQAQLEAEHEQLKTISYLSAAEQAKYAERQSISFMCAPSLART